MNRMGMNSKFKSYVGGIRMYATTSNILEFHNKHDLPPWPKGKEPTPKDIFNLQPQDFNLSQREFNKTIKSTYNKYLKIYHPDIINQMNVSDERNNVMSETLKRTRFDAIQDAYEMLKDPRRRVAYARSCNTSWGSYNPEYQGYRSGGSGAFGGAGSFESYRMANAHRKQYDFKKDEEFWTAGTWEDYYQMKFNRAPPTQEEFDKNKYKILMGVLAVMGISTTIQLMLAFENYNETKYQLQLQNLKLMQETDNSVYNIRGEGNNRFSSLRKMLLHRRSNVKDDEEKLKQMEQEDADVLTDFAKRQLSKKE